jgi:drug/metabolite transporter (DMT)-like permease
MVAASVYQMMRGIIVVITAIMAVIFLGKKLYIHHWLSLLSIVIGASIVGWTATHYAEADFKELNPGQEYKPDDAGTKPLGLFLLIFSQFFTGTQFIVEEKLFENYYLDPFKVVGLEGMWGTIYYLILLPIM